LKLAIVSNGFADIQRAKLRITRLEERFSVILISAEIGVGKPDRRIYDLALEQLDIDPRHGLMVGDTRQLDVLAAEQAGLRAVWLDRGLKGTMNVDHGAPRITGLYELPGLVSRLDL
jgi:HAD superfamily hydrolase (TIGR01509 family)